MCLWISAVDKWKDAVISQPSPFKGISETTHQQRPVFRQPFNGLGSFYGLLLNLFGKVNRVVKDPFTTSSHNE
jgi:hypothetical protein